MQHGIELATQQQINSNIIKTISDPLPNNIIKTISDPLPNNTTSSETSGFQVWP